MVICVLASQCKSQKQAGPGEEVDHALEAAREANALIVTFTYGSEKAAWIEEATRQFNRSEQKLNSGQVIYVNPIPMGSGQCIEEIEERKRETHLVSPASAAFIKLGNAASEARTGGPLGKG